MSRIIVKNLPKHTTEESIKAKFGLKGDITDIKMMKTSSGVFRRFAFIGFKTEEQAKNSAEYFNNTFIDTSKISVEVAKPIGSQDLNRPWSKYSKKPEEGKEKDKEKKEDKKKDIKKQFNDLLNLEQDGKLQEFINVMKPNATQKTWANDDGNNIEIKKNEKARTKGGVTFDSDSEDDENYQEFKFKESDDESEAEVEDITINEDSKLENETLAEEGNANLKKMLALEQPKENNETDVILDTGRLFIRNLSYTCSEDELNELCSKFGPISSINMPIDKETKKIKGYAYVTFMIPEHAVKAYMELDHSIFQGRLLHVIPAKEKIVDGLPVEPKNYKEVKEKKLKEKAQDKTNWNLMFMNPDAIMKCISNEMKVSKSELLNPESDNLAVRMAVAETHVINETKSFLEQNGIDLLSLDEDAERSNKVIVVKNIPFETTVSEIRRVFSRFGSLGRVLIPPTRTLAIVEFIEPTEAKSAFKNLAYSRFKSVPLYLEWAPSLMLNKPFEGHKLETGNVESIENTEVPSGPIQLFSVFIKNLNFNTTEETLKTHFESIGNLKSVTIAKKKDLKNPGKWLSMGYGFAEFSDKESALKAINVLQNVVIDGHAISLKFSTRSINGSNQSKVISKTKENKNCTKLAVKNVPFEATLSEIKSLFKSFGNIKNIRIPKKFDRSHRGFAFVEFFSHEEAKKAMEELYHTHLYGRHLVFEWAAQDESIEDLKEKAKRQISSMNVKIPNNKKIKMKDDVEDEFQ
ncbi:RNA-binding domain-containing protein [Rozella allomycis CSF55]|uniref:RNA-binding domain-containing protein n=1 Tax=Rozella allomycis (strain CSF55) TaxID=988480 RepID=A0A4P9YMS3_ROZAC|nr:RNA-binding domain-containing protein [Rozella allomycis CSF55]